MNVPKLRFKEFNDEWCKEYAGNLCSIQTGKSNTQDKTDDGIYPFYVRSPIIEKSHKFIFDTEAVLTVGDGVGVGKVFHYINGKFDCHQRVYMMNNFNKITAKYFYYIFSRDFDKRVMKMTAKTSVDSVRYEMIDKMQIFYPTVLEQNKISRTLELLDKKIELQTKKIEDLKLFKKGLHDKLFNDVTGNDYLLSDIAVFENGKGHENIVDENGKYILINSKFISTEGNVTKKCSEQLTPLFKNDITMVMSDLPNGKALAKCYYIDENNKYSLNQRICKIKVKDDSIVNSKYLFYLLNRNSYYLRFDDGVNQTNLKKDDILSLNLVLPSIKDQERDSKTLTIIDNIIEKENNKLSKLNLLKKGLMQSMFV